MSNVFPLETHAAGLDDDAWDDLLNFIEEKRVIPIVGPELLKVETETGPRLLYDWIADKLAQSSAWTPRGCRAADSPAGRDGAR